MCDSVSPINTRNVSNSLYRIQKPRGDKRAGSRHAPVDKTQIPTFYSAAPVCAPLPYSQPPPLPPNNMPDKQVLKVRLSSAQVSNRYCRRYRVCACVRLSLWENRRTFREGLVGNNAFIKQNTYYKYSIYNIVCLRPCLYCSVFSIRISSRFKESSRNL